MAPRIPKRNARFIDSDAETDRGRAAVEMLRGYAGAPSQASAMHPGALSAYEGGELAGMAEMLIPGASLAKGALGAALAGVIKPRGGNWIPGDVESSISNLLRKEYTPASVDLQRTALEMARQRGYDDNMIAELARGLQQRETPIVLNRWIEGPLTKYIKRDMATPEDPVRRLADEGILHMGIPQTTGLPSEYIRRLRVDAGFPQEGLSETPGGSLWENLSDRVISSGQAKYLQEEPKMMAENPWMQKLDPESTVYGMQSSIERGLGLDHLVDELNNALNPESGLPRNLLLRPEQMQQMGMEKAVRHVDAINKWRAAQQAAANAELANKGLIVREYAENNPKGLRWMELRPSETLNPEYELKRVEGKNGVYWDLRKPGAAYGHTTNTEIEAIRASNRAELEKQLKYEGDTMGHCVGGYCPDVLEGRSRIFSLRDAKGEPHVTIEVDPRSSRFTEDLEDDEFADALEMEALDRGIDPDSDEYQELYEEFANRVVQNLQRTGMPRIAQIKGKQNLSPKDEYLPFVQDFVRNNPLGGGWSSVGDLRNTGLRRVGDKYVTLDELKDMPKTADGFPIGYEPLDDLPEWKEGGIVEFPKVTPKAMLNRVISAYNAL